MEIVQLNTFSVVARTLHFTKASEELKLTQSAVSHQIKSLEDELGVQLFSREKRRISLTTQGVLVLNYAQKMLDEIEVMRQEIEENKYGLKGTIKLAAVPRSLNSPFFKVKRDFESLYPDIDLFFEAVLNNETVFENVRRGISDLGLTTEEKNFRDLLPVPYGKFEMLFVVGKNHRLANKKEIDLNELSQETWILFEQGSWLRNRTEDIFAQKRFKPRKVTESNDGATIFLLIADGAGVGFLPKWGILNGLEEGKIIPVKLKEVRTFTPFNIVVKPTNRTKLVNIFVDYLLQKQVGGIELLKDNLK